MFRVKELDRSINFYCQIIGMTVLRKADYPDEKFSLVFLGFGNESQHTVLELTFNWGEHEYQHGNAYGHIALAVQDIYRQCKNLVSQGVNVVRQAGPMKSDPNEIIAFIEDPDGNLIELIEKD